jgi:dienelactone hydrolase
VYTVYWYAGANHGFHNDTTARYDKEDAELPGSGRWVFLGSG